MIKKLALSIRQYRTPSIIAPLLVALEVLLEVSIPTIISKLLDYGVDAGSMSEITRYGAYLLICSAFVILLGVSAGRFAAVASAGVAANLRQDIFYRTQSFSFANIDKFSPAGILTRLTTDVGHIQMAYQVIIRMAIRAPMMMIFAFVFAARINLRLSLVFLAVMPVLAGGLVLIISRAYPIFTRVIKTYDSLNGAVGENLRGIRVVKSFNREEHEKEKFGGISESIFRDFSRAEKTVAFNAPLMQVCVYAAMLLISWFGAHMIVASGNNPGLGLTTGQLMSFMTYTMQILSSLMMLSMVFVMLTISRASALRVCEILDEESDIKNREGAIREIPDGTIDFEGVEFAYSKSADKLCLDNINLHIGSGETIGIIGGTGSSKSTLIQLIPRLYDVTAGRVRVGGADVRDYDIESLRGAVAVVLQKNLLFKGTISENIRWGDPDATAEEIARACRLASADEFIERLPDKYETMLEQGGANLSGGQRQRLCIARALIKRPKILILDDSTSAVDTKTDAKIRRAFAGEIPGTTKLIIAQRISSVQDADRIIVMDDGKINAVGTHGELLEKCDIYREVYMSQTRGDNENDE